jgi:hypothetical protein
MPQTARLFKEADGNGDRLLSSKDFAKVLSVC